MTTLCCMTVLSLLNIFCLFLVEIVKDFVLLMKYQKRVPCSSLMCASRMPLVIFVGNLNKGP